MEQLPIYIFYLFTFITVFSALCVLLLRNVLYAAVGLMGTFLGVAGLYVFAGADFLAVTQLVVYVGGILVLMIFGVMISRRSAKDKIHLVSSTARRLLSIIVGGGLFFVLCVAISGATFAALDSPEKFQSSSKIESLGKLMMTDYVLPFELAAVVLLMALVGAIFIAGRKDKKEVS